MVRKDNEQGGGNQPFTDIVDSFAAGITAPTPRIYHQNAEKPSRDIPMAGHRLRLTPRVSQREPSKKAG